MKAISVRQPWVWAIICAGKRIENRSRVDGRIPEICRHRGPLLLHASKGCTRDEFDAGSEFIADATAGALTRRHVDFARFADLPRGGIVARALAIGHVDPDGRFWLDPEERESDPEIAQSLNLRWHMPGSHGLVFADDVVSLPFVPWKGALGLFEADYPFAEVGVP